MAASMCSHAIKALSVDCGLQRRAVCGNLSRQRYPALPRIKPGIGAAYRGGRGTRFPCNRQLGYRFILDQGKLRRGLRILCLSDSSQEEARPLVSTDDEVRLEDTNGRGPVKTSVKQNSGEMNGSGSYGRAGSHESVPPTSDEEPNLVLEVAHNATEVIAETLEVAAKTVSTVGEIESSMPTEVDAVEDQDAAVRTVVFWVSAAVVFGTFLFVTQGSSKASEFFAGYLLEQSLSVDNLFVFVLIFNYFKTPVNYQSRVLTYGIAGAVFFRAFMITLGAATLQRFEAINLFFAAVLLFSAYKLFGDEDGDEEDLSNNFIVNFCQKLIPVTSTYDENNFFTIEDGFQKATPLLLTLAVVELSDIAFAVDSIPAVFGVTRDPLIVFSSNMFAILGLRSLYTLISGSMAELEYLQPCVGAVLGFIGSKMVIEYFGFHISTELSLGVVAITLGLGVGLSILAPSKDEEEDDET
ncbi:thylakoid membrane protein TERC, chloroplastic [Physcomitrium patens]|uniref:Uncharacterized protein n=2 Tax=Physcomitrium patens TaxID=3218 RepID=A0A2K1JRJ8_PHYPA|nr:thylakoid membrane protein TERC, chloroplastic-like [Physcomitrium patens]PNR44086.1 hypothetical protein PHYPA_016469 [Physcomitrium patens]|eukprot:XP_024391222.1 thylakoid membrane protein TERC, chloroplastic-like [Physcomitrella patens]